MSVEAQQSLGLPRSLPLAEFSDRNATGDYLGIAGVVSMD